MTKMLNEYLSKFKLYMQFSESEVTHFLIPRTKVIYSYVVRNKETNEITDFFSFYNLPSSVLKHEKYDTLWIAYSYYNFSSTGRYEELTKNALIQAKQQNFDVFNILDLQDNKPYLKDLKFGHGDGHLHYYLYNWRFRDIQPNEVGMVLV